MLHSPLKAERTTPEGLISLGEIPGELVGILRNGSPSPCSTQLGGLTRAHGCAWGRTYYGSKHFALLYVTHIVQTETGFKPKSI